MKKPNPQRRQEIRSALGKGKGRQRGSGARTSQRQRGMAAARFREPLTGKRARQIASAMAATEYRPIERSLGSEVRGSAKREQDIDDWYAQLDKLAAENASASTAAGQSAEEAITKRLADAGVTDKATLDALAAQDAARAERLGGPTNTRGLEQIAAGNATRAQQAVTLTTPLTAAQANFGRYLGQRRTSAAERGIEARQSESQRRRKIREDLRAAKKEEGQAKVKNLQGLREGERDFAIQRMAFTEEKPYEKAIREQARLGLKGSLASSRATERSSSRYAGAKRRSAEATERSSRNARKGKERSAEAQEKTAGKYSRNSDKGGYNVREAKALLRSYYTSEEQGFANKSAAVDYLVNRGVDAATAKRAVNQIARSQAGGGGLGKMHR